MQSKPIFIYWALLFIGIGFVNPLYAASVTIEIKVENPTHASVAFAYQKKQNNEQKSVFRINLGVDNQSIFQLDLDQAKFVDLLYGDDIIPLYFEGNENLHIFFDGNKPLSSIRFSGKGNENNATLCAYHKQFKKGEYIEIDAAYLKIPILKSYHQKTTQSSIEDYATYLKNRYQEQKDFLQQNQNQISASLLEYLQNEAIYTNAYAHIAWHLSHPYETVNTSLLPTPVLENEQQLLHPSYQVYLDAYLLLQELPHSMQSYKAHFGVYEAVERHFTGKVKCFLQARLLEKVYNRSGDITLAEKHFQRFATENPYTEYTEKILAIYGASLSGIENLLAPTFDMLDTNGKIISLDTYKNKVVYISFWASWCKPCIESFKKSEQTRQDLQNMGVVLLNVSIDKKQEAWEAALLRHRPIGINGLVLSLEDISKKYDISTIPLYHIVNKNGKFSYLTSNGQRDIIEEFRTLLEQ